MKNLRKSLWRTLTVSAIFLTLFFSSCEDPGEEICTPSFNLEEFENNVNTTLDGNVMGYAYVITQNGQVVRQGAKGNARNAADGQKDMTVNQRMHVASVSKFITTVAVMHLLDEKNLDVNDEVADYLPPDWRVGAGFDNVTFLDLLAQQAGLNQTGTQSGSATRFDSLRTYVAAGALQPKTKKYSNTHHAMFRVILPRLWNKYKPNDGKVDADFTESVYQKSINELLFEQVGINGASCTAPGGNANLAYQSPGDAGNGTGGSSDFEGTAGGFGWNLSAMELAKFWAYCWYTDDFIDEDDREIMMDNTAGLWNTTNGAKGVYYNKLGGWNYTSSPKRSFESIAMHYPNNIDIVIITNSPNQTGDGLVKVAREAYDDAIGCF